MTQVGETSLHKQPCNRRAVRTCAAAWSRQRRGVQRACLWTEDGGQRPERCETPRPEDTWRSRERALNIQCGVSVPVCTCAAPRVITLTGKCDRVHLVCAWETGVLSVLYLLYLWTDYNILLDENETH